MSIQLLLQKGIMMGAWGYQTFEDDIACDWLDELADSEGIDMLAQSLSPERGDDEYLEYDQCIGILAAAEIIYGILNQPRAGLPDKAVQWIQANRDSDVSCLKSICEGQLSCVLYNNSELQQLWEENAELYPKWKAYVESLLNGLKD